MNGTPTELNELLRTAVPRPKLAAAESITGGRVQALITGISGASEYFVGGVTAYTLEQKDALLGIDRAHALACNCVSERVAGEMAGGACRLFQADLAVATTGYAEPAPAQGVAMPFAWIALARGAGGVPEVLRTRRIECPGLTRNEAQDRVAAAAIELLVAWLRCATNFPNG
jgi:nicotinamide-nucleotide amidase